jgi:hypothetical protein
MPDLTGFDVPEIACEPELWEHRKARKDLPECRL